MYGGTKSEIPQNMTKVIRSVTNNNWSSKLYFFHSKMVSYGAWFY